MNIYSRTRACLWLCASFWLISCGETQFEDSPSQTKLKKKTDGTHEADSTKAPIDAEALAGASDKISPVIKDLPLIWHWDCAETKSMSLVSDPQIIKGIGAHEIGNVHNKKLSLKLEGDICQPDLTPRDIIIVIDVSDSMFKVDRWDETSLTCERKNAVLAIVDKLGDNSHIGLVTFNDIVKKTSETLLSIEDFKQKYLTDDTLCKNSGGTDFSEPLKEASQILATGRTDASKEIYFVTDGVPNDSDAAKESAEEARKTATIASVMIGDANDKLLREHIATKDSDDLPLHVKSSSIEDLTATLENLFKANLVSAEISYRPKSSGPWIKKDLFSYQKEAAFIVEDIDISESQFPDGIEVKFEYLDSRSRNYKYSGSLHWTK